MIGQAIVTKVIGPTDTKDKRITARCGAGAITVGWNHALSDAENHIAARKALQFKLAKGCPNNTWLADMATGGLPDGTYVHVFV